MQRERVVRALCAALIAGGALGAPAAAHAVNGPQPGSVTASTVVLPSGPGSIQGLSDEASVDVFSAQVSYQVPLTLPSAAQGLTPALTLEYAGDLGNGPMGIGWHLGQVMIRRSTRLGVPFVTDHDELLVSGVVNGRLVEAGDGTYRVEGHGQSVKVVPDGDGFTLFDGNGWRYRIGVSEGSRQSYSRGTVAWYVEETYDVAGQRIRHAYHHDQGQVYLQEILWGPGEVFRVSVELGARPDPTISYESGARVVTARRIEALRVHAFGEVLRVYDLGYYDERADDDGRFALSRLHTVTQRGRGEIGALPPLTFDYAAPGAPALTELTGGGGWRVNDNEVSFADIDRDGAADLLRLEAGYHAFRKNLHGTFGSARTIAGGGGASLSTSQLVDLDGDASAELVYEVGGAWHAFRLEGATWVDLGTWGGTSGVPVKGPRVRLADFNGDGRIDAMRWNDWFVMIHFGNDSGLDPAIVRPKIGGAVVPGDDLRFQEFNGDGITDAVLLSPTGSGMTVYLGRGDGTFEAGRVVGYPWSGAVSSDDIFLDDLDRDGLLDLVTVELGHVSWYPGRPDFAFGDVRTIARPPGADADVSVVIADANGNGSADVVWSGPAGMWALDLAGPTTAGMLVGIDNGLGKSTTFEYRSSHGLASEAAVPWTTHIPVSIPVPVTRDIITGDTDALRRTEFSVRDPFWDRDERRFGGFLTGTRILRGATEGQTRYEEIRYHAGLGDERVLRGKPLISTVKQGNTLKEITVSQWRALEVSGLSGDPLLRRPALERSNTTYYGSSVPVVISTEYQHDAHGNPRLTLEHGRLDRSGDERRIERTYASDDTHWIRDRVCEETTREGDLTLVGSTRTYFGDELSTHALCVVGQGWVRRVDGLLTDSSGSRWVARQASTYDDVGNPLTTTAGGVTRTMTYDANKLRVRTESVSPRPGKKLTWTATWDDVLGAIDTLTDPNGVAQRMSYDSLGRQTSVAVGSGQPHIHYVYDWVPSRPRTVTYTWGGELGAVPVLPAVWSDDSGWRQDVSVANGAGEVVYQASRVADERWALSGWRERDERGQVVFYGQAHYHESADLPLELPAAMPGQVMVYDALGRLVEQRLPNGGTRSLAHGVFETTITGDVLAPVVQHTDGLGRVYLTERELAAGTERVAARYDAADRLRRLDIDGGTVTHRFDYDTLGRMVEAHDPDIGLRVIEYDDGDRMTRHTNGAGDRIDYAFDGAGRLVRSTASDGAGYVYHYDKARSGGAGSHLKGRLAWVEEPTGEVDLSYDAFGRQDNIRRRIGKREMTSSKTLGATGQVLAGAFSDGFSYRVQYDPAGRATEVDGIWQALEIDANGDVIRERFANGIEQVTSRDAMGSPSRITSTPGGAAAIYDVEIQRNTGGVIDAVVDHDGRGLDHSAAFTYDDGARLTDAVLGTGGSARAFAYRYDGLQNMISRTGPSDVAMLGGTYRYGEDGAGPRQLTSISAGGVSHTFTYDAAGRQEVLDGKRMIYNALDQLVRVDDDRGSTIVAHDYGFGGERIRTRGASGTEQSYWFAGVVDRGTHIDHYVSLGSRILARVSVPGSEGSVTPTPTTGRRVVAGSVLGLAFLGLAVLLLAQRRRPSWHELISAMAVLAMVQMGCSWSGGGDGSSLRRKANVTYFHYGVAPGPLMFTDHRARVVEERRYEPFGAAIDAYSDRDGATEVDHTTEPHNSLNKMSDPHTELSFHGARWMAPQTGRWLTPDPPVKAPDEGFMNKPWGLNPYQYVDHNPVLFWDPDGRSPASVDEVMDTMHRTIWSFAVTTRRHKAWKAMSKDPGWLKNGAKVVGKSVLLAEEIYHVGIETVQHTTLVGGGTRVAAFGAGVMIVGAGLTAWELLSMPGKAYQAAYNGLARDGDIDGFSIGVAAASLGYSPQWVRNNLLVRGGPGTFNKRQTYYLNHLNESIVDGYVKTMNLSDADRADIASGLDQVQERGGGPAPSSEREKVLFYGRHFKTSYIYGIQPE